MYRKGRYVRKRKDTLHICFLQLDSLELLQKLQRKSFLDSGEVILSRLFRLVSLLMWVIKYRLNEFLPSISFIALMKSEGSLKLTKPKPLLLLVLLSLTTLARWKELYLPNVRC